MITDNEKGLMKIIHAKHFDHPFTSTTYYTGKSPKKGSSEPEKNHELCQKLVKKGLLTITRAIKKGICTICYYKPTKKFNEIIDSDFKNIHSIMMGSRPKVKVNRIDNACSMVLHQLGMSKEEIQSVAAKYPLITPEKVYLTNMQKHVLWHTVGNDKEAINAGKKPYRNYYLTTPGCDKYNTCEELVELELMISQPDPFDKKNIVFHLTDKGLDRLR